MTLWRRTRRIPRTAAGLFAEADRQRRDGRYAEAVQRVTQGLSLEPDSVTGHLLAAYLHAAARAIEPARREFHWVLARDPVHPRALLGLARIALEEGDLDGCRQTLERALSAHPDFPQARALLDGLAVRSPGPTLTTGFRLDRLRAPAAARALFVVGSDGGVLSLPPAAGAAERGGRLVRAAGLAAEALRRAGFGPLRRAIVEDVDDCHYLRADPGLTLVLSLPRATPPTQGLLEVNRLWAATRHELVVARDEAAPAASGRSM